MTSVPSAVCSSLKLFESLFIGPYTTKTPRRSIDMYKLFIAVCGVKYFDKISNNSNEKYTVLLGIQVYREVKCSRNIAALSDTATCEKSEIQTILTVYAETKEIIKLNI
jgi:hypothetical protein